MQTHEQASAFLGAKVDRPLPGRATRLQRRDGGAIAVRYHHTDVVTYYQNGVCALNSGGWRTVTTKARMNEYGPSGLYVYSQDGTWYLCNGSSPWSDPPPARWAYEDGIRIGTDGRPLTEPLTEGAKSPEQVAAKTVRTLVSRYLKTWAREIARTKYLADPSGGDCWGCFFAPTEGLEQDPLQQKMMMGVSHLLAHMVDGYCVPSLAWRAMQRRGNPAFCWQLVKGEAEKGESRMLCDDLRSYFRRLRPRLVAEVLAHGVPDAEEGTPEDEDPRTEPEPTEEDIDRYRQRHSRR